MNARGRSPASKPAKHRHGQRPASIRRIADSKRQQGSIRRESEVEASRFRVLVAVHRPRYRARTERAMAVFEWDVRSLLNKEDPVGIIHQKSPHIFVMSEDFGRQKDLGILRAVQRFRHSGLKIIALFDNEESARDNSDLCDVAISPPWTTSEMRWVLSSAYAEIAGEQPSQSGTEQESDENQ